MQCRLNISTAVFFVLRIVNVPDCKGIFNEESVISFLNLQRKIFKITIIGGKSKFQVQDRDLEYIFWRFAKHITLSGKNRVDSTI